MLLILFKSYRLEAALYEVVLPWLVIMVYWPVVNSLKFDELWF
jgi:hypothetical protein